VLHNHNSNLHKFLWLASLKKCKLCEYRFRSKRNNDCGHPDKEHYAKGMCNNCYHKYGRTKKPWICGHDKLYACEYSFLFFRRSMLELLHKQI
jgi:hypothetical protein